MNRKILILPTLSIATLQGAKMIIKDFVQNNPNLLISDLDLQRLLNPYSVAGKSSKALALIGLDESIGQRMLLVFSGSDCDFKGYKGENGVIGTSTIFELDENGGNILNGADPRRDGARPVSTARTNNKITN
jgi:hypothetical protein